MLCSVVFKVQYQVTLCIICGRKYESGAELSKFLRFPLNVVIPASQHPLRSARYFHQTAHTAVSGSITEPGLDGS
jgi:hypothetical protein